LTEHTLLHYFNGKASAEMLMEDILGSSFNKRDASFFNNSNYESDFKFCVTTEHLIKLCKDIIANRITAENLRTIVFCLYTSNHFFWDTETDDGKIVEDILSNLSTLEQNGQKTITYLQYCVFHFETGSHR